MEPDAEADIPNPAADREQVSAGATLMPAPIANAISFMTRSSALYLRLGTFIGGLAIDGARITTLTSLELSRAVIEGILSRAGKDITVRSKGDLGRAEAEGILEKSIATLHYTMTQISFAASAGFHISTTALSSTADFSQQLLAILDSILGSTDSSRAIASIITLIRREFQNPATGQPGEKVGVLDLLVGICGLALLQRWCKRLTDFEAREKKFEDVICWDVVILNDGRRGDVIGVSNNHDNHSKFVGDYNKSSKTGLLPLITTTSNEGILHAIQRQDGSDRDENEEWPETSLKEKLMKILPPDANVSITTDTTITKTITVEITGTSPPDISPPPGVEIVEETSHHAGSLDLVGDDLTKEQRTSLFVPRYRVVYRTIRNKLRDTNIQSTGCRPPQDLEAENYGNLKRFPDNIMSESTSAIDDINDIFDIPPNIVSPEEAIFSLSPLSSPESEAADLVDLLDSTYAKVESEDHSKPNFGGFPAIPVLSAVTAANQKKTRRPKSMASSISGSDTSHPQKKSLEKKTPLAKKAKLEALPKKGPEKRGTLRNALRKGSGSTHSTIWNKEQPAIAQSSQQDTKNSQSRPLWGTQRPAHNKAASSQPIVPPRGSSIIPAREAPSAPQRGNPNYFSSRDLGLINPQNISRAESRASYYSIHERRRDSLVSQTDTYSIHSSDTRPPSPTAFRTQLKAQSNILRAKSEKNISVVPLSPQKHHRRSRSYVPSIYTLKTNNSETSLVLAARPPRGIYEDTDSLESLIRNGRVDGLFPRHHMVRNITRFIRFASASYGASFMRVMGITTASGVPCPGIDSEHHYEHHSFSNHTQLPPSTILLSSFIDPQGGTDMTGNTNTGVPMVHYISLDHDSKAVVLTCRGTLGFEDVLTDLACDYDDIAVRGKVYKVHKGIHASALRLLAGNGCRVLATLAASLEEFPDYGLVLCGHSLGGGVVSLLAIMLSEPSTTNSAFVTAIEYDERRYSPLTSSSTVLGTASQSPIRLPSGRPIHVYAYGPPATMSPSLRLITRGLITSIVNGQDVVPYLSLGVLHDLQAVALAFKTDDTGAKGEVRARVWAGLSSGFADKWYGGRPAMQVSEKDDEWAYSALKTLRASMLSAKLVPPGEVFVVESMPVLQRDAFTQGTGSANEPRSLGRPATRAILKYVKDAEKRFGELRFGGSMLLDHSPGRYEASLAALGRGVLEV